MSKSVELAIEQINSDAEFHVNKLYCVKFKIVDVIVGEFKKFDDDYYYSKDTGVTTTRPDDKRMVELKQPIVIGANIKNLINADGSNTDIQYILSDANLFIDGVINALYAFEDYEYYEVCYGDFILIIDGNKYLIEKSDELIVKSVEEIIELEQTYRETALIFVKDALKASGYKSISL